MSDDIGGKRYRSLFLSDVHLGTKGCQAELLLDFLSGYDADTIYLVGDIVDGWRLQAPAGTGRRRTTTSCRSCCARSRKGARIVYIPGNHDEFLRDYHRHAFRRHRGRRAAAIHEAADGRRYLVIHGDQFDMVVRHASWLAHLGDGAYTAALVRQHRAQHRAPPPRPHLLVALGLGEAAR